MLKDYFKCLEKLEGHFGSSGFSGGMLPLKCLVLSIFFYHLYSQFSQSSVSTYSSTMIGVGFGCSIY